MDCFCIGRLQGTRGTVRQYTAIDAHSSYPWEQLHTTPRNPIARYTSALAEHIAAELAARGWRLEAVSTDKGWEFTSARFRRTRAGLGPTHRRIHAGRPQSDGFVERVLQTLLEECWKPAFARHLVSSITGLRRELARYVWIYNTDRAHAGRIIRGRTPDEVLGKAKMWAPPC